MDTKQTPQGPDMAAREAAAAEEQRLWLLISDPGTPPTERVKAYVTWLQVTRTLKELGVPPAGRKPPRTPG